MFNQISLISYKSVRRKFEIGPTKRSKIRVVDFGDVLTGILKKETGLWHHFLHAERIIFPTAEGDFSYISGMTVKAPLTSEEERILEKLGLSQSMPG